MSFKYPPAICLRVNDIIKIQTTIDKTANPADNS